MMGRLSRQARLALLLIARATPAADREWVLGDSIEEFEHLERTQGSAAAHRWLRREVWRVLVHAPRHRYVVHFTPRQRVLPTGGGMMAGIREDLRYAFRQLGQSPGFTAVILLVLALSIGASTAVFSVADAVVLRGLPFDEHDRIVAVLEHDTTRPTTFGGGNVTPQTYLDWRALQESFEGLTAVGSGLFWLKGDGGEPVPVRARRVTWEFFPTLRAAPLLGRAFTPDDEVEGRHRVALLSHGLWQRRFGGSPEVVGQTIEFGEESWEIVGVMPHGFTYPAGSEHPTDLYVPLAFTAGERTRGGGRNYNFSVIGRLRSGVSIDQASDQMNRVAAALDEQHPEWGPGRRIRIVTLHDHLVESSSARNGISRPWAFGSCEAAGSRRQRRPTVRGPRW